MRWQGGDESGDVEDRRGLGPVAIGGGGVGAVVIALIGYFVFGVSPDKTLQAVQQNAPAQQQAGAVGKPTDEEGQFVDVINTSAEKVWTDEFAKSGRTFENPTVVLYTGATQTACGVGQEAMGPFYCPNDRRIYLDVAFFRELESKFGAPGDFARAYVIAHEFGHHVQNLLGVSDQVSQEEQRLGGPGGADGPSVRLELQADCYAGVWARQYQDTTNRLDPGDIQGGLTAAAAVGDDKIESETQGQVVPDSFTHGTSAQRTRWFKAGYEGGDPGKCDTFSGRL